MSLIGPSAAYQEKFGLFKHAIVLTSPQQVSDVFYGPEPSLILVYWKQCGHCHKFAPTYDEAAERYGKQIKMCVIEVADTEPRANLPAVDFFSDGGVPRVAAVKGGEVKATVKGNDKPRFLDMLKKLITPVA